MMKETVNKFVDATNEVKDMYMKQIGPDVIEVLNPETLALIQATLKLVDASNELLIECGKMMDEQNNKLNILLARTKNN